MGFVEQYLKTVRKETGMRGVYPPMMDVALGDYGPVRDGRFTPIGNIGKLKSPISFDETSVGSGMSREFKSTAVKKIAIGAGAAGSNGAVSAKARLELEFGSQSAIFVAVAGCSHNRIADIQSVGTEILKRYRQQDWREDWKVVTELIHAANTTVIVSREKNSKLVLEAAGSEPNINMADANLSLRVVYDSTASEQWITEKPDGGMTPFCFLSGIVDRLFQRPHIEPYGLTAKRKNTPEATFEHFSDEAEQSLIGWRISTPTKKKPAKRT